jgi:ferredoxin
MSDKLKVHTDREDCISCGNCWSTCPRFFEQSQEDGYSQIISAFRVGGKLNEGEAPAELSSCVNDAAEGCPVQIIHVG